MFRSSLLYVWVTRGPFGRLTKSLCDFGDTTPHTLVGGALLDDLIDSRLVLEAGSVFLRYQVRNVAEYGRVQARAGHLVGRGGA